MTTMILPINNNMNAQYQEVYETADILVGGIQTLNEDTQRLSYESVKIQNSIDALTGDIPILKLSIQEQNIFLDGLKINQDILQQDVLSLKQKLEDMQFISYDGTLTWKITKFKEKMSKIDIDL
ncbi:unnamed protein product [Rotaria sp. Silwood1]|nr:unnamed protein product [Rotaria sp. Silwood1]CAF1655402.1 unnamed protein product [Rotaria sp. Silwood1]